MQQPTHVLVNLHAGFEEVAVAMNASSSNTSKMAIVMGLSHSEPSVCVLRRASGLELV